MCFQVKSSIFLTPKDGTVSSCSSGDAPPHRLQRSAVQLRKVNRKQRCLDVELDAERPVTEQEEERDFVGEIRAQVQIAQRRQGSGGKSGLRRSRAARRAEADLPGFPAAHERRPCCPRKRHPRPSGCAISASRKMASAERCAVPGGRKEQPSNDGNSHAEKDHRRCVIPHRVVNPTGFGGESVRDTEGEKS